MLKLKIDLEKVDLDKYKTCVKIKTKNIAGEEVWYSLPKPIFYHIIECYHRIENNLDAPIIITGPVGSGKSNLGDGICGTWEELIFNRAYNLKNIHFSATQVVDITNKENNKTESIKFDEAVQGGSSKDGMTKIGHIFRKALITKRYKKHLYVIITDSVKELNDKLIERCLVWYHVFYDKVGPGKYRKGRTKIFSPEQALKVYEDLKSKKYRLETKHPIIKYYKGPIYDVNNFKDIWFSEDEYNNKKTEQTNLLNETKDDRVQQRNEAIMMLIEMGAKQVRIAERLGVTRETIKNIKDKMRNKKEN